MGRIINGGVMKMVPEQENRIRGCSEQLERLLPWIICALLSVVSLAVVVICSSTLHGSRHIRLGIAINDQFRQTANGMCAWIMISAGILSVCAAWGMCTLLRNRDRYLSAMVVIVSWVSLFGAGSALIRWYVRLKGWQ